MCAYWLAVSKNNSQILPGIPHNILFLLHHLDVQLLQSMHQRDKNYMDSQQIYTHCQPGQVERTNELIESKMDERFDEEENRGQWPGG